MRNYSKRNRTSTNKSSMLKQNPFVITNDVVLQGNRTGNDTIALQLIEKIKELPVDKNVSVLIPPTVINTTNGVTNLILKVRRLINLDKKMPNNFAITVRTFKDGNGEFINARVWRIN